MKELPVTLLDLYRLLLERTRVSKAAIPHYYKWLPYYVDFCEKYSLSPQKPGNLPAFLDKLASKGQGTGLRNRATEAVELYYDAVQGLPAMEVPQSLAKPYRRERLSMTTSNSPRRGRLLQQTFK